MHYLILHTGTRKKNIGSAPEFILFKFTKKKRKKNVFPRVFFFLLQLFLDELVGRGKKINPVSLV